MDRDDGDVYAGIVTDQEERIQRSIREWKPDMSNEERRVWSERLIGRVSVHEPDPVPFLGKEGIKAQIEPFVKTERFPHTLIVGEPGMGKTQLARWIAAQRGEPFEEHMAPIRPADLRDSSIVLLDEAHRQKNPEELFRIMDGSVTVTILAATTRPELLDSAFASRFLLRLQLELYTDSEMEAIVENFAGPLFGENPAWLEILASASAGNPRQAERIVMTAKGLGTFDPVEVLRACRINADGLSEFHMKYLAELQKRSGQPIGLEQISMMLYADTTYVRQQERLLLHYELINLKSNGRVLTRKGIRYNELLTEQTESPK